MPATPMPSEVRCQILPRRGANAEQMHVLFERVADWTEREVSTGAGPLRWLDSAAAWGLELDAEPVPIDFVLRGDGGRRRLIDHLREVIPHDLVEDVSVDGRSWRDEGD